MLARAQKISSRELAPLREQISKKLQAATDTLESISGEASIAAERTLKRTGKLIRARPLQTVGIVAAAGLVLGFLRARR